MSRFARRLAAVTLSWLLVLLVMKEWWERNLQKDAVEGYAILVRDESMAISFTEYLLPAAALGIYALLLFTPPLIVTWLWERRSTQSV